MKHILVPTDFSDNALKAALFAAEIAQQNGAIIYFMNALELGSEKVYQPFSLHEKYNTLVTEDRMKNLVTFSNSVTSVYKNLVTHIEVVDGFVTDIIPEYCRNKNIDLVIMGTKGAGGVKEVLVGSVTSGVISKTKVPVLAVPGDYAVEQPDAILFATSHFEENTDLLLPVVELARLFDAAIHVAVFVDTKHADAGEYMDKARNIDHYLKFLWKHYPDVKFAGELIDGTNFEAALERYALKHEIDIITMIPYQKSFFEKIIHHSATKKMACHSHIPVLAIPAV